MKNYHLFKVAFMMFLGLQTACCHAKEVAAPLIATSAISNPTVWGAVHNGLQAQIRLKKDVFGESEPIELEFIIKNVSDKPIEVWHCGFWCNHKVVVTDAEGQEVASSAVRLFGSTDRNIPVPLQPGQEKRENPTEIRRFFSFMKPGVYHVEVSYINAGISVVSNSIQFTIQKDNTVASRHNDPKTTLYR